MTVRNRIRRLEKVSGVNSGVSDNPLVAICVESAEDVERIHPFITRLMPVPDEVIEQQRGLTCDEAIEYYLSESAS